MYASKNIVENLINSKDHTTLVAAAKVTGSKTTIEHVKQFNVVINYVDRVVKTKIVGFILFLFKFKRKNISFLWMVFRFNKCKFILIELLIHFQN